MNVVITEEAPSGFVPLVVAVTQQQENAFPRVQSFAGHLWVDWVDSDSEGAFVRFDESSSRWGFVETEPYGSLLEREYHLRGAIRSRVIEP